MRPRRLVKSQSRHARASSRYPALRNADRAKVEDYLNGKADQPGKIGDDAAAAALADKILALIAQSPVYYTDIAEHFRDYAFGTVARAIGHLHQTERLWQDERGRMCVRGSKFAAKLPI